MPVAMTGSRPGVTVATMSQASTAPSVAAERALSELGRERRGLLGPRIVEEHFARPGR